MNHEQIKNRIYLFVKTGLNEVLLGNLVGISPYSMRTLKYKRVDVKKNFINQTSSHVSLSGHYSELEFSLC